MNKKTEQTTTWLDYERGLRYLESRSYYRRCQQTHKFTSGNQWDGLAEKPPVFNILRPILKSATALVGQNNMTINYTSENYNPKVRGKLLKVCEMLGNFASVTWERLKLDAIQWQVLQDAYITGDAFLYFYWDKRILLDTLDSANVMLGDEQNPEIQSQPYVLIIQRKYVRDVLSQAVQNGVGKELLAQISADDDLDVSIAADKTEVENNLKCLSITKLWRGEDGFIHYSQSTKAVEYTPEQVITGLTLYPIAKYTWNLEKGQARGLGDIWSIIPNQLSINKNAFRFDKAVQESAYPHIVYDENAVSDEVVSDLTKPGSRIAVADMNGSGVGSLVSYLQPGAISPFAKDVWQDLIILTREMSGAGDNLENVNPEHASGAAINAARDAKTLNVNMQVSAFRQFVEDIAKIWFNMWVAYNPDELSVVVRENGNEDKQKISAQELGELMIEVRIDISPSNPYSKLARELSLKELLSFGALTFEEYVSALDDTSNVPKDKLLEIIAARKVEQEKLQSELEQSQIDEAAKAKQLL